MASGATVAAGSGLNEDVPFSAACGITAPGDLEDIPQTPQN